ncbi:MAG: cobyrinate a,c-diamide synthase [Nodosilinea sp.]
MAKPHHGGLVIAGERSGVGKTTVTLALLAALSQRSSRVQSFKVGPDYIDPMFHRQVTGRPCYNLDPILTSETYVQQCFHRHCQGADFAIVEGVMGLFDGASGDSDIASTAHIAKLLNLPVLLVVDCSRLSRSVLAIVHGYRTLDPDLTLAGVVLNRVGSDRHLDLLKAALAAIDLPILGILHRQDAITIPDRHLGLVPTAELPQFKTILEHLTTLGQTSFHWPHLTPHLTLNATSPLPPTLYPLPLPTPHPTRIAVAQDAAFSFYYPDNLDILTALGAELVPWSPLADTHLPEAVDGLYFGGGFPEMFASELAANQRLLNQLQVLIQAGLPTYAECGGLMYLATALTDFDGQTWPMVGVLPTTVHMEARLTLGYRQATALQQSPWVAKGQTVWGHEFHRSQVVTPAAQPLYQLQRYGADQPHAQEGWRVNQVHASYVHLHWGGCPEVAQNWVVACLSYRRLRGNGRNRSRH